MCLCAGHQHSQFWPILARFMDYYSPFWGPKAISMVVELQGVLTSRSSTITVWADSGPFLVNSCTITPRAISTIDEPRGAFMCSSSTLTVLPILTRFLDYYPPFCGPEAISIVVERQDVLMCWSSTLAVLADSGPFHGLLLTVLGSQSDFHGCRTRRCAYVSVNNNHSLGRFWPVSWTITQFWGPGVISMIDEPQGAFTCRSSTLTYLADSSQFMHHYS